MDLRKIEKKLDVKAIFRSVFLNLIIAGLVFFSTYFISSNVLKAFYYMFITWSLTLSLSAGYWVWYVFKKIKAKSGTKRCISYILVAILLASLVLVWYVLFTFGVRFSR